MAPEYEQIPSQRIEMLKRSHWIHAFKQFVVFDKWLAKAKVPGDISPWQHLSVALKKTGPNAYPDVCNC